MLCVSGRLHAKPRPFRYCGYGAIVAMAFAFPAQAQDLSLEQRLKVITDQLKAQQDKLAQQDRLLKLQQDAIDAQKEQIARLNSRSVQTNPGATTLPPVGEAPPKPPEEPPQVVQSLPQGIAVLTPAEHFTFMPSLEYTQTTNARLVFEGVVIVPGINLGEVTASTDDRSIASAVLDLRYGILDRLEVEVRLPFTFSDDRATVLVQAPQGSATQSIYISNTGIGDVELGARYQVNAGRDDWPVSSWPTAGSKWTPALVLLTCGGTARAPRNRWRWAQALWGWKAASAC